MIEFVTILTYLFVGSRAIEVAVGESVASVEFRLNGDTVAYVSGEPWRTNIEFESLLPSKLEAIAYDAMGNRLESTTQFVFLTAVSDRATIFLEDDLGEGVRFGRLFWENSSEDGVLDISLDFDGRSISASKDGKFYLPNHDRARAHFLSAEIQFWDGGTAKAEVSFGGLHGSMISETQSSIAVLLPPGSELPSPRSMNGWFTTEGRSLSVAGFERGPGTIAIVRCRKSMRKLKPAMELQLPTLPGNMLPKLEYFTIVPEEIVGSLTGSRSSLYTSEEVPDWFFAEDGKFQVSSSDLRDVLVHYPPFPKKPNLKKVELPWNAAAIAGSELRSRGRPRAILVLLAEKHKGDGYHPKEALGYLRAIQVPTFVWLSKRRYLRELPESTRIYIGPKSLRNLMGDIYSNVSQQWVVWLEGAVLPNRVGLTDKAPSWIELAN